MGRIPKVVSELKASIEDAGRPGVIQPFSADDGLPESIVGSHVLYRGVDYVVVYDLGDFAIVVKVGNTLPAQTYFIPVTRDAV